MISDIKFIPTETADKIKDTAVLKDVILDFIQLKPSGSSFIGACPCCNSKKKFNVNPSKSIWKCFVCEVGGKDSISFLMKTQGKDYPQSLVYLADRYNILIEQPNKKLPPKKRKKSSKTSFRNQQLRDSGIPIGSQKFMRTQGEAAYEFERYSVGTIDKFFNVQPGDDMILHYVDLNWMPMTYTNPKGKKLNLKRVRWANPHLHLSKDGDPMKYKSPYKSGSHIWIPNKVIKAYHTHQVVDTLIIQEGEKKADKACEHGLYSIAIMGIHNFTMGGEMPHQIQQIIKRLQVKNIIFLLDSDWQDISAKPNNPIEQRPKLFWSAVKKFKEYFEAYRYEGIELKIHFGHGKDEKQKGIDDLLTKKFKKNEVALLEDFKKAMHHPDGAGEHVNIYNITTISEYKLKEFWNLHSPPKFLQEHREQLLKIREFYFNGLKYRVSDDDEIELAQAVMPNEQYWMESVREDRYGNEKKDISFDYYQINIFLKNRGYGLYETPGGKFQMVKSENKIVEEVTPHKIQRFVQSFTEHINKLQVLRMLLKGGSQYLGPDKLSNMRYLPIRFREPNKHSQYLFFKNCFWKITEDNIEQRPLNELPMNIWRDQVVDFEPTLIPNITNVSRSADDWKIDKSEAVEKCQIADFIEKTSCFFWRKYEEESTNPEGQVIFKRKAKPEIPSDEDYKLMRSNIVSKMIAIGYTLHEYRDYSQMKAIICMDGEESEIGKSQGGTGKSIIATSFEHLIPTEVLDAKKRKLEEDGHLYDSVTDKTQLIVFDDCRTNLDFEHFLSQITRAVEVNQKGERKFKIRPPRFWFTTNHAMNGEGNSFERRQYYLSFSDYFNKNRTVADEYGGQLFHDWDHEQWNLFYNFYASCIQTYLKYGLKFSIPKTGIERRRLRQKIGENVLEFCNSHFHQDMDEQGNKGIYLNLKINKDYLYEKFIIKYPQDKRYVTPRIFKVKVKSYADYAELDFNPTANGNRLKSGPFEYFILADDTFDVKNVGLINNDMDMDNILLNPNA